MPEENIKQKLLKIRDIIDEILNEGVDEKKQEIDVISDIINDPEISAVRNLDLTNANTETGSTDLNEVIPDLDVTNTNSNETNSGSDAVDVQRIKVVSAPIDIFQSFNGRYFFGQTNLIRLGRRQSGYAAIENPADSKVNLYISSFTVTNESSRSVTGQVWIDPEGLDNGICSDMVSPANIAYSPIPVPNCRIVWKQSNSKTLFGAGHIYDKLMPANFIMSDKMNGKIVIPPGKNFVLFFTGPSSDSVKVKVAFEWWEAQI